MLHYILFSVVIISLLFITIISYRNISLNNQATYLRQSNEAYSDQISVTIDRYEVFSEYIFHSLIDQSVLEIMALASSGDNAVKDLQRTRLYDYLLDDYILATEFDFRQLHFHLPNGDSFLRFHTPERYGDNLFEARSSIRLVNTNLEVAKGFEEGRIYNGYRFVYPLFYDDDHVGSVEVSTSISTIIDMLYANESESGHFFIIKAEVVEGLVFDDFLDNYISSRISDDYLYDKVVYNQFREQRTLLPGEELDAIYKQVKDSIEPLIFEEKSFYYTVEYEGTFYTLQLMSLENIDGSHVGYIFTIYEDDGLRSLIVQDYIVYSSITLFYMVLYFALFIYIKDKKRIVKMSQTDTLTGLYNRTYFNVVAAKELDRSNRYQNELSLILMDIDHFKKINDRYGHLMGDDVLKEIAEVLKNSVRKYDVLTRWGGEEFALLLPQTSLDSTVMVAKKIQKIIANHRFPISENITLSFGLANRDQKMSSINELFQKADKNLFRAKDLGRDTIVKD